MADGSPVVVDTSAFVAFFWGDDLNHTSATDAFDWIEGNQGEFWTTSYALVETIVVVRRRIGFSGVVRFVQWLSARDVNVLWMDEDAHEDTWNRYASRSGEGMSFVDWSLAVAADRLDAPILAYDSDFTQAGLPLVAP